MSNLPDIAEAVANYVAVGVERGVAVGVESGDESTGGHSQQPPRGFKAINHRYDKIHSDVRPYAMMTQTCFMEYDPMEDRGVVPGIYARSIGPVIANVVFFQDINLNQIQINVERDKSKIYFTHGWSRMRDFYGIGPGAWIVLVYVTPFVFRLRIRDITGTEITYPLKDPPYRLMLDKDLQKGLWDAPIPYFVLPKDYSHILEKTLTAADVASGSLTLFWRGFCENALPNEDTQLTLIDWLGNAWKKCDLHFDSNPRITCRISGDWVDVCKVHRLADGVVVKFGVTGPSNNKVMYFKLSPFIGVRTTLYAPSTSGGRKAFYQTQQHFML